MSNVVFDAEDTRMGVNVSIIEDDIFEYDETLLAILSVPDGERGVALTSNDITNITIIDNDGELSK